MPTKRALKTAAPAAKPITAVETEVAVRPAGERKRKREFMPIELTAVQQQMADLLADIVANGSSDDVVDDLVAATARHFWHRRLDHLYDDHADVVAKIKEYAVTNAPRWKSELAIAWAMSRRTEAEKSFARTISERVRESVVDRLRDGFEEFIRQGTPEEHRLMVDVFEDHGGGGNGYGLAIAEVFSYQTGQHKSYIPVQDYMRDDVEKYIESFRDKDAELTENAWSEPEPIHAEVGATVAVK